MIDTITTLRLRPGVHVAPVPGGLSLAGRGATAFVPGAEPLAGVWDALFPLLHNGLRVDELPPSVAADAGPLLRALADAGLLLPDDDPATIDVNDGLLFARTINYLESCADRPYTSFRRVRAAYIGVVGAGAGPAAAIRALVTLGVGHIATDAVPPDPLVDHAGRHGATIDRVATFDGADVVITFDRSGPVRSGVPWCGAMLAGEVTLVGPVGSDEAATLADALAAYRRRTGGALRPASTSPVVAALAGNLAAMEAVLVCAGVAPDTGTKLIRAERLALSRHPVRRASPVAAVALPADAEAHHARVPDNPWMPFAPAAADPVTGVVEAPEPVPVDGVAAAVARCGDVHAVGPDARGAARAAFVNRARSLVPPAPATLWTSAGEVAPVTGDVVAVAGPTSAHLWRDGARRLLHRWLAGMPETAGSRIADQFAADQFAAGPLTVGPLAAGGSDGGRSDAGGSDAAGSDAAGFDAGLFAGGPPAEGWADLVGRHPSLSWSRHPAGPVTATAIRSGERIVALAVRPAGEPEWPALLAHADAAMAVPLDPILAESTGEDWDGRAALASLADPHADLLAGRWRGEPLFDDDLILGWISSRPRGTDG